MSTPNMYKQAISNNITLESYPFPSELGMEAYLMDNPSILKLDDNKYGKPQIIECEMSIDKCTNRKTRGRIDMVVRYSENVFGILELKKHALDKDALYQLCDYLTEREKVVNAINQSDTVAIDLDPANVRFVGVLVGGYIDDGLRKEMPITDLKNSNLLNGYANKPTIEGYTDQISAITLERFRNPHTCEIVVISTPVVKTGIKDTTKYQINGEGRFCSCILFEFYIKPQLNSFVNRSTSGCILFEFYIKPQHFHNLPRNISSCILFEFYIKPQQLFAKVRKKIGCI